MDANSSLGVEADGTRQPCCFAPCLMDLGVAKASVGEQRLEMRRSVMLAILQTTWRRPNAWLLASADVIIFGNVAMVMIMVDNGYRPSFFLIGSLT